MRPFLSALTALAVLLLAPAAFGQYVGVAKCRTCHPAQVKSWEQTKLAKAFDMLKPGVAEAQKRDKKLDPAKDYTHDAKCLRCHVTGYGKPGGFESVEKTPAMVGVQCEACHGAGGNYLKPELMSLQNKEYKRVVLQKAGLAVLDQSICQTCHNSDSPFFKSFEFNDRKTKVHLHVPLRYPH